MQENENEERRQAELDFVEAAYDPEEAWCVREDTPQICYRIQRDWILCISMPRGYPEHELLDIGFRDEDRTTNIHSPLQQQLLHICRTKAAAMPGEEAVFAVMNAAAEWIQQQLVHNEEDVVENAVGRSTAASSSVLLQKIPPHLLSNPRHAWTKSSNKWDVYKLVRKPIALTALVAHMSFGAHVCGTDDRSLFLKGNTHYDANRRRGLQSVFSSKLVFRLIWLDDYASTRYEENIEVWGTCHEAVAETASWLFSLPDQQRHILSMLAYSNSTFSFEFFFSELLFALLSPNPFRQVRFGGIDFSEEHCAILATQEQEVNLVMAHCWLAGGGVTFLECLQQRKTPFGSLTLESVHPFRDEVFVSLFASSSQNLTKLCLVNLVLRSHETWLPFRIRARHVEMLHCSIEEDDRDDGDVPNAAASLVVLPKAFVLGFDPVRNNVHYHRFLEASHGLNKLGIQFSSQPTGEQMQALFRAMEHNPQWKVLELGQSVVYFKDYWQELMSVLRNSSTIVKLRLHTRNARPDAEMLVLLQQLLEVRRHITVVFPMDDWPLIPTTGSQWEIEMRPTMTFNRWYLGVLQLQSLESQSRRDALFGRALFKGTDFRSMAFLLASHLDVLLMMLEELEEYV